jgi:plasmid replication initiation protein
MAGLEQSLKELGEAVRENEAKKTTLVPERYPQLDLFMATGITAVPKDELASMEHPIFAVEDGDTREVKYEHNGDVIEIIPSVRGRATQHDKDVILFCVSKLVAGINQGMAPSRTVEITARELLLFTNSDTNARSYALLAAALDRLSGTRMKTSLKTGKPGKGGSKWFGLIDSAETITRGPGERMEAIRITLSEWTYNAVLALEVLTIPREYFRLRKPIAKRIYELARKHCGDQGRWKISLDLLQKKVGSRALLRKFRAAVISIADDGPLLDYHMRYLPDEDAVVFYNQSEAGAKAVAADIGKAGARKTIRGRRQAVRKSNKRAPAALSGL